MESLLFVKHLSQKIMTVSTFDVFSHRDVSRWPAGGGASAEYHSSKNPHGSCSVLLSASTECNVFRCGVQRKSLKIDGLLP